MKQFLVATLTFVTALSSIWANLGDGSDRIENRYGNLVQRQLRDDETVSVLYHKDRYLYLVIFANDRSVSESYSHINGTDRKSTRLNSSHLGISYAVFCL